MCFLEVKKKKKQQKEKTKIEATKATTTDINEQIVKTKKGIEKT